MSKDAGFHSDTTSDEEYKKAKQRKRKRLTYGRSSNDVVPQVEAPWSCDRCTYINPVENKACDLCSTSRPLLKATSTAPLTPRRRRPKATIKADTSFPWTCQACTYINDTPSLACTLCDTSRSIPPTGAEGQARRRGQARQMESIDSSSDDDDDDKNARPSSQLPPSFSQGVDRVPASNTVNGALWNDKYQPSGTVDLVMHPKKIQEVSDWLANSTHHRILFLCGPPGTGKSTVVRSLAAKLGMAVKEWQDTSGMTGKSSTNASTSAMDDFGSFLERSQRYPSLDFGNAKTAARHVILVEEWPSFHSDHRAELQRILQRRLDMIGHDAPVAPIVIVYSDVREGKVTANMLAKEFSAQVVQSPLVHMIHCNPIAPGMLKKYLTQVARKERLAVSAQDVAAIVDSCRGDLRHAMNTLQFQRPTTTDAGARDPFLSDFHVIGKILHRKEFTEECRLSNTSLDTTHALGLIHQNMVPYFTDVDDVARALDWLSFTDVLLHSVYHDRSNSSYFQNAQELAQAVLERTVHVTNAHPAPSSFRPLNRSQHASASHHARDVDQQKQGASYHRDVRPYLQWLPHASAAPSPIDSLQAEDLDDDIVDSDS